MFILLRRIERWLHQHIFKVGWLITQNYQTTTIFYYTIFLPGVVLHQLVYWLAAGMLNVRADRSIKWPEAQEVGELKLNFVQINPKAHVLRKAIITIAPLLVGLISIWYIAHNIFDITAVFRRMSSGDLRDVAAAFEMLLGAPLFWLWIYVIFTVANTMYPSIPKDLRGWRSVLLGLGTVALALLLLGLGGEIFEALQSPLSELIFVLQATFILMIAVDVLMVLVLGLIEYTIERTTGNSATFRGGKMITVTREEALEEQHKQREQALKEQAKKRNPAADTGLKSIYALAFSIPGIPPQEPLTLLKEHTQASIEMPAVVLEEAEKVEEKKAASMPLFGGIAANMPEAPKPLTEEQKAQRESIAARINMPERLSPAPKPAETGEKQEESSEKSVSEEPKRQSSLFDKTGTSEAEKAEEKPVTSRFGGFNKPVEDSETSDEPEEKSVSIFAGFSRPAPANTEAKGDSEVDEPEEKSVTSRFGGFSKPAITSPIEDAEASDEPEAEEKPVASRLGGFSKPAITSPVEDAEASDEPEAEEKPVSSRFGGFSKPVVSTPDDKTNEPEEKPVSSRFGGFSKPAITSPVEDAEASDEPEAEEKPVASRFGGFNKPAITSPVEDSEASDEPEPEEKPVSSRFGGFSKPVVSTPDDKTKEPEEKPVSSRFGGFNKPAITSPVEDSEASDEPEPEEKPVASRFGGFGKPPISTPENKTEEAIDEPEAEEKPVAARFGGFNKPAITNAEASDEPEEKPLASRFGGLHKPAVSTPEDKTEEASDEPEAEKPVAARFGGFNKAAAVEPGNDEDESKKEEKPGTSRFSFSKPTNQESGSDTSRFGASPFKPANEPADKEEKPAAPSSRFASTEFRRVETEDNEEEGKKPALGTSPFSSPSRFGAARPAPKPFGKDEEGESDEDDEEVSRPASPLLGRQSGFGTSRPAPKFFGSDDEDEEVDEEEEAPRSRVSGFGLLGKRPKDDEIVYEEDDDDFRNYSDDVDDYVDSDDD